MVTTFNLLYSIAAVRRLYKLTSDVEVRLKVWWKVIWVWVEGRRPTLISKTLFKVHFVEWRKQKSKSLKVTPHVNSTNRFGVCNPVKESVYEVFLFTDRVSCTCEDYVNQVSFLGRGCCKHGYAVLGHLGFSSLGDYLTAIAETKLAA